MNEIKISLIGAGYWGKNLARNLDSLGVLHSICDHAGSASALAKDYGVPVLLLDEILSDKAVDGVMIATPTKTHFDIAKKNR